LVVLLNIWNNLTWDAAACYGLPPSSQAMGILVALIFLMVVAAGMLGSGWLAEWSNRRKAA
jgi:hypothetical protein